MSRPHAEIVDRRLFIEGMEVISPPYEVQKFLWLSDERLALVLLVRGNWSPGNPINQNVVCISVQGDILWVLDEKSPGPVHRIELMDRGLFPGHIVAWGGDHRMAIDKNTGKLLYLEFTK
ncbi:MAG: hypothetical protein ACOY9J_07230 [Pseudomonadota bacterium]